MTMKTVNKIIAIFLSILYISCLPEDLVKEDKGQEANENIDFMAEDIPFKMIYVKGGTFTMGATSEQSSSVDKELPTHRVTLKDYYIGETEVTQELWSRVMGTNPSFVKGNRLPVTNINYNDIQQFISKINLKIRGKFSLPTEAEWEFAARGGTLSGNYRYSGSNTISDVSWYSGNSKDATKEVAQLNANELGIYDMSGNVYEICNDWMFSYAATSQTNPIGSEGEEMYHSSYNAQKATKGGSKGSSFTDIRTAARIGITVFENYSDCGFRLALNSSATDMPIASATIENITETTAEATVEVSNIQKYNINLNESSATAYEITDPYSARQTISITPDSLAGFLRADTSRIGNIIKTKGSNAYSFSFTDLKPNTSYAVLFWLSTSGGKISIPLVQFMTSDEDITLSVSPTSLPFTAAGGFFGDVNVTTNALDWDVNSSNAWCEITKYEALKQIGVTVGQNPYTFSRTATITVTTRNIKRYITVIQAGKSTETFTLSPTEVSIEPTGGLAAINVIITNVSTYTATSNQRWCSVQKNGNQLLLTTERNTNSGSRTAIVTVRAGSLNQTVTVTQNGIEDYNSAQTTSCDNRIKFQIVSCKRSGTSVVFTYSITNTGMGQNINDFRIGTLFTSNSSVFDDSGTLYTYKDSGFSFGGKTISNNGYIINTLPLNVKINATITLMNVNVNVKKIANVKVHCYPYPTSLYGKLASEYYYFVNVPIY